MKVNPRLLFALLFFYVPLILKSQEWTHLIDPQNYNSRELESTIQEDHPDYFITYGGGFYNLFSREGALVEQSEAYLFINADTLWSFDINANLLFRTLNSRKWRYARKLKLNSEYQHGIQIKGDLAFVWRASSSFFYRFSSDSLWEQSFIWQGDTIFAWTQLFDQNNEGLYFTFNDNLYYFKDTLSLLANYQGSGISLYSQLKKGINGDVYFNFKRDGFLKCKGGQVVDTLLLDRSDLMHVADWSVGKDLLYIAYVDTSWKAWLQSLGKENTKRAIEENFRFLAGGEAPCALVDRTKFQKWNGHEWIGHEFRSDRNEKHYLGGNTHLWLVSNKQVITYNYQDAKYEVIYNFQHESKVFDVKRLNKGLAIYKGDSLYMFSDLGEVKIHKLDTSDHVYGLENEHYIHTFGASVYFTLENKGIYEWNWEKGVQKLTDKHTNCLFLPITSGFYLYTPNSDSLFKLNNGNLVFSTIVESDEKFYGVTTDKASLKFGKAWNPRYFFDQKGDRIMNSDLCHDSYSEKLKLSHHYQHNNIDEVLIEEENTYRFLQFPESEETRTEYLTFGLDGRILIPTNDQNGVFFSSPYDIHLSHIVEIRNKNFTVGIKANGVVGVTKSPLFSGMLDNKNQLVAGTFSPVLFAQHNEQTYYSSSPYILRDKSSIGFGVSEMDGLRLPFASVITKEDLEEASAHSRIKKFQTWPAVGNPELYSDSPYAPFEDLNNNGFYDPIQGDKPKIFGDASAYLVASDLNKYKERIVEALDVELHTMAWVISGSECLDRSLYIRYTIVNRSDRNYDSLMFGLLSFENMSFDQEYFGSDSLLDARYYYSKYSEPKSVWGITHLNHSLFRHNYAELNSSTRKTFPHDMDRPDLLKNYFRGLWTNGERMMHGNDSVLLYHTGDPVKGRANTSLENLSFNSQRSSFGSSPFFSLHVGERKHLDYVINWVDSDTGSNISNINLFRECVRQLKEEYKQMEIDYTGASTAHPNPFRVDIEEHSEPKEDVFVYPNPSDGLVKFSNLEWKLKFVINSQGQEVDFGLNNNEIDLKKHRNGLYTLIFEHQNGQWQTKRIVLK